MNEDHTNKKIAFLSRAIVTGILFAFWLLLSGLFDVFHMTLGIICSAVIGYFSYDLVIRELSIKKHRAKKFIQLLPYWLWLIWQVISANVHVAYLVLNPTKIDPKVVRYKSFLKNDFAQVTYANSITLTPGTITMDIDQGDFVVHALSQKVVDDLNSGEMEDKIARIFMETKD